ncbi:MAG TPA: hypothetical protein VIY27_11025 [Myxococcota bacterium]
MRGAVGAFWGVAGVVALLASAVYRLGALAIDAFSYPFFWYHWVSLVLVVAFMAYSEGLMGFQRGFSPRVASRARYLRAHPRLHFVVLAPLFCMGFFHATRRRRISSFTLTAGIVVLVLSVRLLPQPWRGIVDAGVVVGLAWGLVSLIAYSAEALTAADFAPSPEVPER